ncbi:MBL fold metallo-hydrolase [Clostridium peptidivorans]|uniref:MBL fold metallo-hydrolase n=1 Tax=Clostridium peptidivorans TaxID=100174 RepID=UPI000BE26329|nr:MBL fold metallo-hydrolase [Clostridium peptidivorans]
MQTLSFLGRGSAFNTEEGNSSAYIKHNDKLLLIDCGESIFERIKRKKLLETCKDITILITHLHSDHVGSLSSLIFYCYYMLNKKVSIIYPSPYALKSLFSIMNNKENMFNLIESNENVRISLGDIEVMPVKVSHSKEMDCYGYFIYYNNKTIYYSGDSNNIEENTLSLFKNGKIDELYQDTCYPDYKGSGHLSISKLSNLIPEDLREKVYCIHIDGNELIESATDLGFNIVAVNNL